ncbi:hypothetical protein AB0I77_20545 [Streptomyces sp. NPDC050619]|uniref:hypothetical protein n=1 Tax=Streptomyces sp. NPDC050619 TaxID=3157214 RepID=UPI003442D6FD
MLRHDFLPRIVDEGILTEVFTKARKFFEPSPNEQDYPTMPVEFSVAAYRLGHSMVRGAYNWNREFDNGGVTLPLLFRFTGTSGILAPPPADLNDPEAGTFERLPTTWVADFRRLFDFRVGQRMARRLDVKPLLASDFDNPVSAGASSPRCSIAPWREPVLHRPRPVLASLPHHGRRAEHQGRVRDDRPAAVRLRREGIPGSSLDGPPGLPSPHPPSTV